MTVILRRKAPNPLKGSKGFKPGVSGNPAGRKPGPSKLTLEWQRLHEVAASDLLPTYETIRQYARKGKEWAVKLQLKLGEKGMLQEIQHVHHDAGSEANAGMQIATLLKAMSQFKYYTKEQLLNSLDTLAKIKNSNLLEPTSATPVIEKTQEQIEVELRAIELLIKQKEEEEVRINEAKARQQCI